MIGVSDPHRLFVGLGLCVAVVALTIAPKRTPESRARPESGREVDRRRRAAGAAIGAGLVGIAGGQGLLTIPSHPVWIWMLAGLVFWGVPLVAVTIVARWAAKNLNRPWADVFWSWDGRRLPDPIGTRGTAIFIGSFVAGFAVASMIVL